MERQTTSPQRVRRWIASVMVVMTLTTPAAFIGFSAVTVGILAPQPVSAAGFLLTFDSEQFIFDLKEILLQVLEGVAKVGIKSALKNFFKKLAYDTAVWIASGGKGQKPLVHIEDVGTMLRDAWDAEIGTFLNGMSEGFTGQNLCEFDAQTSLQLQLILPQIIPQQSTEPEDVPKADCTLSKITKNFKEQKLSMSEQFAAQREDPNFYVTMANSFEPGANPLSAVLEAMDEATTRAAGASRVSEIERLKSDFQDKKASISGYIQTPASVVQKQYEQTIEDATKGEEIQQDNIFADAIATFVNTLAKKLLERVTSGLFNFFTDADIGASLSGESSPAGASAGVAGAKERFAELKTPSFTNNVEIDILTQMAACPEQGVDVTNCVIDGNWRMAIEEQMTVQQAIEQNVIDPAIPFGVENVQDPAEGISIRNLEILKQYNVVPVTWLLAAEYMRDFDGTQRTLGQMLDAYGHCTPQDYSPYCGLVDPNWVLKAPEALCKVQGFGETIINDSFINADGSPHTPDERLIARLDTCLDTQTCLTENDEGECLAYGYCTKQEDIYRFEGDSCPIYQASCEEFKDEENKKNDWLLNTLNFGDCSSSTVGCQWRCSEFNVVDQAFQCAGQNQIYPTCTSSSGCGCTVNSESCTIAQNGFQCTTTSGALCQLPPVAETSAGIDAAITFDSNVRACSSNNEGCTEFIAVKGGANLLFNGDAQLFNNYREITPDILDEVVPAEETTTAYDDTFAVDANGQPCTAANVGLPCYGWELHNGATVRAAEGLFGEDAAIAMQVNPGSSGGYVSHAFNTGQPLENRTFTLRFSYRNPTGADCTGAYWIRPDGAAEPEAIEFTYLESDTFNIAESTTVTFADTIPTTTIRVGFEIPAGCTVALDGVKLEENDIETATTTYGEDAKTLNINKMNTCTVEDVGCELFTPKTGESDLEIPGKITNPLSEACAGPEGFASPLCSQCPAEKVGCDAFIEVETPYTAPIKDIDGFNSPSTLPATTADAIASRTGYYCDGTTTACNSNADCVSGSLCLPSVSLQPSTAEKCTATNVGCEEYINLDTVAGGGEGKEYYKFIKQCVKPTTDQYTNNEIETYFTWEGSDQTGYQLRSWELKKSNVDNGPCTNLDLYDVFPATTQTPEAKCVDNVLPQATCTAAEVGLNPDCNEYYDESGNVYYRLRSATITVSEECVGLRNSLDNRTYYSIPSESLSCPASANQCREYRGSEGGNVQLIINENFNEGVWFGGYASSEVVTANNGSSMAIGDGTIDSAPLNPIVTVNVGDQLDAGDSYVATFWAKTDNTGPADEIVLLWYSTEENQYEYFDGAAELTNEWQQYTFGPFVFAAEPAPDEAFGFEFPVGIAYIDNVELRKSDSQYLIKGSFETCVGYEGCEQYTDTKDNVYTLKSFERLCTTDVVGCTALIDTNNSNTPYPTAYNTSNEFSTDDVFVGVDNMVTYAVNDQASCEAQFAGCSVFGTPTLNEVEVPTEFEQEFLVNDPDDYSTSLCGEQQRSCEEYTNSSNETVYFKNPGSKQCTYNASDGKWVQPDGSDCPTQNPNDSPSQPKGPICNGGLRVSQLCNNDSDCPNSGGGNSRCVSNANNVSGWVGQCLQNFVGCRLYTDPNTPSNVTNYSFESDVVDNDDATTGAPDGIPDDWFDFSTVEELTITTPEVAEAEESSEAEELAASTSDVTGSTIAEAANLTTLFGAPTEAVSPTPFEYTNVRDISMSSPYIGVVVYDEQDYPLSVASSYSGFYNYSGTFYDNNSGNPSTSQPMIVSVLRQDFITYADRFPKEVTVETGSWFNQDSVTFTIPYIDVSLSTYEAALQFYVSTTGALYWADSDHNGIDSSPSPDLLSSSDAFASQHLVTTSTPAPAEEEEEPAPSEEPESTTEETSIPATPTIGNFAENGFADAVGNEVIPCGEFIQSGIQSFDGIKSVKLVRGSTDYTDSCMAGPSAPFLVDPNKTYTLSANVFPTSPNKRFAVGLLYYDVEGNELSAGTDPENYAIAAFEGPNRNTYGDELVNKWNRFHATIGPNLAHSFPPGTTFVRVFIEAGTDGSGGTFFDNVVFSENAEYAYLSDTVDGAPGSDVNTCNGEINIGDGCVAFRDVLNDSLTYTASVEVEKQVNADFSTEACTFNSPLSDQSCDSRADTADTNAVIRVRSDRQCSEWLSCSQARIITDDNGNQTVTCFDVNLCTDRNPDTGVCNSWENKKNSNFLGDEDQVRVNLQPGSTSELSLIQNMTGYARVGAIWAGVCVPNPSGSGSSCVGGAAAGDPCTQNLDCSVSDYQIIDGYYPFNWMPQRGLGTAGITTEVVPQGDFENVTCSGVGEYTFPDGSTQIDSSTVQAKRDRTLFCTIDQHCRTTETDTEMQSLIQQGTYSLSPNLNLDTINASNGGYTQGWCQNVEDDAWSDWTTVNDAEMYIIDYDPELEYDKDTLHDSALGVNLNNVLRVESSQTDGSGVQVNLGSTQITELNSYTVSFNAQYLQNPDPENDEIAVVLTVGDSTPVEYAVEIDTVYQLYAVGPLDTAETSQENPIATLKIVTNNEGNTTPFIIDNVSIKPTLEVRANDNGTSELIARECRGYPVSDSVQCDYTTKNGTIFEGWKGYCLEDDNMDPSRCVAWWPVDVISGEADSTPRNRITYAGTYPAYQCLVAKGNAQLGVCSNDGTICSANGDCNSGATCQGGSSPDTFNTTEQRGQTTCTPGGVPLSCALVPLFCFAPPPTGSEIEEECNAIFTELPEIDDATDCFPSLPPTFPTPLCGFIGLPLPIDPPLNLGGAFSQHILGNYNLGHQLSASNYIVQHTLTNGLVIDRFGSHWANDPIFDPPNTEWAVFKKFEPSKLEKSIHISEIEQIDYNLGNTIWNSTPGNNAGSSWKKGRNTFYSSSLEENSDGALFTSTYDDDAGSFDTNDGPEETDTIAYAWQEGLWCGENGSTICNTSTMSEEELNDADFVITKAVTTAKEAPNIEQGGRVNNNGIAFNPFATFANLRATSSFWNDGGQVGEISNRNELYANGQVITLDSNAEGFSSYFFNRYSTGEDETADLDDPDDDCWSWNTCGANVMAVKFDFEDGYLQGVYLIYWNGLMRFDVKSISNIWWKFHLREPCLLAVESADTQAQAKPWQTRIQPDSTYQVRDLGYTFSTVDANAMYGTIRNVEPPQSTLTGFDGKVNTGRTNFTAISDRSLPMVQPSPTGEQGSALPYACIGNCTAIRCENPTSADYGSATCTNGAWKGFDGVCSVPDSNGNAELCNGDSDCSNADAVCNRAVAAREGVGASFSNYNEQLAAAAETAWDRYKLLFADIMQGSDESPTSVWYAAQKGNSGDDTFRHQGYFSNGSKEDLFGGVLNEFTSMSQCTGEARGTYDYCYFRPDVDNIRVNDQTQGDVEIPNGSTVTLTFDSFVDPDQEPITTIAVDWYGDASSTTFADNAFLDAWEAASTYNHTYTNVYTCDPTNGDIWNSDKQACEFKVKIRIRDNWNNCSGDIPNSSSRDDRGANCNSYDEYDGSIFVSLN